MAPALVGIELASPAEVQVLADLAKWILLEQDRTCVMVAAGLTRDQAERIMNLGD